MRNLTFKRYCDLWEKFEKRGFNSQELEETIGTSAAGARSFFSYFKKLGYLISRPSPTIEWRKTYFLTPDKEFKEQIESYIKEKKYCKGCLSRDLPLTQTNFGTVCTKCFTILKRVMNNRRLN